jgi:hypothetical protein
MFFKEKIGDGRFNHYGLSMLFSRRVDIQENVTEVDMERFAALFERCNVLLGNCNHTIDN